MGCHPSQRFFSTQIYKTQLDELMVGEFFFRAGFLEILILDVFFLQPKKLLEKKKPNWEILSNSKEKVMKTT